MRKLPVLVFILILSTLLCFSQTDNYKLKKVDWVFSQPDFDLKLDYSKTNTGKHNVEIDRKAANETEQLLIKKAEALYPKASTEATSRPELEKVGKVFSPTVETSPYWSSSSFDGVKIAQVISTRAIKYYQELSSAYREKKKPTSISMSETSFSYSAKVVKYAKTEFDDDKYENVNVVYMKMSWSQFCGNLCAMGFSREKIVIFDKNNEPLALIIDSEDGAWVS